MKRHGMLAGAVAALFLGLVALAAPHSMSYAGDQNAPSTSPVLSPYGPYPPKEQASHSAQPSSVDELLDKLASIKARKAELEKAEKKVVAALKEKFARQAERMKQLGVDTAEPPVAPRAMNCTCTPVDETNPSEHTDPPELGAVINKDKRKVNRVAILTRFNPLETHSDVTGIDYELAGVLARLLREECEAGGDKIEVVPARRVQEYKNNHPNWKQTDLSVIGYELKADYLISLEINWA